MIRALRPPARRHRPQHAGALRLLARPQRRRDEHRQPGQPLRLRGDAPLRGTAETLETKTGVYVISPAGKLLKFIPIPEDFITNNAFGGPDMQTLYITAGKTLYKLRTDIPGLPR